MMVGLIIPEGSYTLKPGLDSPYDHEVLMVDLTLLDMDWECNCSPKGDSSGKSCDNCLRVDEILNMKDAAH